MEAVGKRIIRCFTSTPLRTIFPAAATTSSVLEHKSQCGHRCWPKAISHSARTLCVVQAQRLSSLPCIGSRQSHRALRTQTLRFKSSASLPNRETVYVAPLKGAVRAVKVFSLSTAVGAFFGGPILVWLGNPSVHLAGRVIISSLVMLAGLGTTAVLHWLVKGYVMKMEYNRKTGDVMVQTISMLARPKTHNFNISEAGPPSKATAFSSFQAKGKSFFMHTEVFQDRELLSKILGAYSVFEEQKTWRKDDSTAPKSN